MDQAIRNKLRSVVTQCRRLLEESIAQQLQGKYDIYATGKKDEVRAEKDVRLGHLSEEKRHARQDILAHFDHIEALGYKPRESLEQLIREIAFTHLNRLCAYKMMEVRDVYVGGQRFREAVSKGLKSQGFLFYLADHPDDEKLYNAGDQETAYRHFLNWLGGTLSQEIGVLFSPTDPANRVYPPQRVLDEVLDLLNSEELKGIWSEDETIGWVYQYFTPKELRDQARKESQAPRNSYELAFRNQFFTPRYVVEFLTDNTLGRIWYEMRQGNTRLKDECRYMVRRADEVFLANLSEEFPRDQRFPSDIAFLTGEAVDFPVFPMPVATVHPAKIESGVIQMGWVEYDEAAERLHRFAHAVRSFEWGSDPRQPEWFRQLEEWNTGKPDDPVQGRTQDLWDLLFAAHRAERFGANTVAAHLVALTRIANEIRRRLLECRKSDASREVLLHVPVLIPHRPRKDPRDIKILDPACGSGHFLLYCFALLLIIYDEAYDDPELGPALQDEFPTPEAFRRAVPGLILSRNLHGIDIDARAAQIAALALWLRAQRAYKDVGLKARERQQITRTNVVCAEPMPGEEVLLDEFLKTLRDDRLESLMKRVLKTPNGSRVRATSAMSDSLSDLVRNAWRSMKLAAEAGSLLKVEEELLDAITSAEADWEEKLPLFRMTRHEPDQPVTESFVRLVPGEPETFWGKAEELVLTALEDYTLFAGGGQGLVRRLFADDAVRGFAFIDLCRLRFDVVLMNPPFGEGSKLAKTYFERAYPRTKNDVYAAFVECGLARLLPGGLLGAITSRTGFFLTSFKRWREEILLRDAEPTVFADLGYGVLDTAMVETAAYCLRKILPGKDLRGDHGRDKGSTTLAPLSM